MKLNKKIVAGLATAALFAPLALNNVQAHADDSKGDNDNVITNKNSKTFTKSQVVQSLKDNGLGGSAEALNSFINNDISSKIQNIAGFTNTVSNLNNDNKKSLLNDFLNDDHNTNGFIKSHSEDNASDISSKLSDISAQSQQIKSHDDDYKKPELKKYLSDNSNITSNDQFSLNADALDNHSVDDILTDIDNIAEDNSNNADTNFNTLKSHNTNGLIKLGNSTLDSGNSSFNPNDEASDGKNINDTKSAVQKIKDIKTHSHEIKDYNQEQELKNLLNNKDSSSFDSSKVTDNVDSIVDNISDITKFNFQVNNVIGNTDKENNVNSLLKYVLNKNGFTDSTTGISGLSSSNEDGSKKATNVAHKLTELYNESNNSPSSTPSYQPPVVFTSNNNSNSNNTNQSSKPTETNNSHEVQFPSAPKSDNVVKDSHATKVNNAKSDVKKAEKQLANAKSNKAKNNATKSINKAKANLAKLNGDQKSTLKDAKKSVKKAEKQLKKAKTSDARKSANASLKAAQTNYTQLNKYIK